MTSIKDLKKERSDYLFLAREFIMEHQKSLVLALKQKADNLTYQITEKRFENNQKKLKRAIAKNS